MERIITSRDNPAVKDYVRLGDSRRARYEQKLFVTEGLKITMEAFAGGCEPVRLYVTEQAHDRYQAELSELVMQCGQFWHVTEMVAEKLARMPSSQGVFGVFRMLDNDRQPVTIKNDGRYLLLCSMQDPGNVGTILRTAAALGIDGVFLSADCPDLYSPKLLRGAMGGVFKLPVHICEKPEEQISQLRQEGVRVYAAALCERAVPIWQAKLGGGTAIVIGNESAGLSAEMIACCDQAVVIPMQPGNESLNAAMAAGILIWEMTRQTVN